MTARVWTREELEEVWRLPKGWEWIHGPCGWCARTDGGIPLIAPWPATVSVGPDGAVAVFMDAPSMLTRHAPGEVIEAVWSVHKGRDSVEALAKAPDEKSDDDLLRARDEGNGSNNNIRRAARADGRSAARRECAAMLRRGTVKP